MLTMFEITLAPGAWAKAGRLIIYQVGYGYILFFIVYVWGVTFAVIRVISAIFLQQTMKAMAKDEELANHELVLKRNKETRKLKDIFDTADVDGGGDLNKIEFRRLFRDARVRRWLSEIGLEVTEVSSLFMLMDDGDGKICFEEFISGVMRLRGQAKTIDLATLLHENKRIRCMLTNITSDLKSMREGELQSGGLR